MKSSGNSQGPAAGKFSWLVIFFGLAYFCQHFAQAGFITQPLSFYFKEVLGLGPKDVTTFFAVLTIPWMIKPLYGLISDYVPLFGYRRKSYLLILSLMASGAFLGLAGVSDVRSIQILMLITAASTAFCDVAVDGLMVEIGNKTGMTARFQSTQWFWFYVAAAITSFGGGWFAEHLGPESAFKWAAVVTAVFPAVVMVSTWLMVEEERSRVNIQELQKTTGNLVGALKSRTLWIVLGFLAFWQFSPSFGTPMYYHQTDVLEFSQEFIGQLGAIAALTTVAGAWFYRRYLVERFSTRQLLYASVAIGTVSTLAYLLLIDPTTTATPTTAVVLHAVLGAAGVIAFLTTLNLAAEACPKRVEALVFAALMSVFNFAQQGSNIFGAWLYEDVFNNSLAPLIWVSAALTFACFFLIPFLPQTNNDGDEDEEAGSEQKSEDHGHSSNEATEADSPAAGDPGVRSNPDQESGGSHAEQESPQPGA